LYYQITVLVLSCVLELACIFHCFFTDRVPKPVIEVEKVNLEFVYLSCKNYNGTITWSNSAGEKLAYQSNKESITVQKNEGNPENSYTCKLKNAVSEETSDPVHKKDLFQGKTVIY